MTNRPLQTKSTDIREERIVQVFWGIFITLGIACVLYFFTGKWTTFLSLFIAFCVSASAYYYIHIKRYDIAGLILILMPTVLILFLMWTNEGTKDESIVAIPALLTFAILFSEAKYFIHLLILFSVNIILIGVLNEFGIYTNVSRVGGTVSAIVVVLLLGITVFSIYVLAKDLKATAKLLKEENRLNNESREHIEELLYYDTLTKLPNRNSVIKMEADFIEQSSTIGLSSFVFDLDDFKNVNDTLGQKVGDEYLAELCRLFEESKQPNETFFRLSGDLLLLVSLNSLTKDDCRNRADAILQLARKPIVINDNPILCTVSVGINHSANSVIDFQNFILNAEFAMHASKADIKGEYRFYEPEMDEASRRQLTLSSDLAYAIERNELEVYYQPKWNFAKKQSDSVEALLRWKHPVRGFIPPDLFIPMAEKTGKIIDIGEWVIQEAFKQTKEWQRLGLSISMAINVSGLQFKRPGFAEGIADSLRKYDLSNEVVELEFTESLLMEHSGTIQHNLQRLHDLGIKLAIDDFGTGYSNLSYLQNFDIDVLKIDKSFIDRLSQHNDDQAIIKAIIQMAKALNMETVAEGVEKITTSNIVYQLGCDIGQGYLWAKPMPAEECTQWLLNQNDTSTKPEHF